MIEPDNKRIKQPEATDIFRNRELVIKKMNQTRREWVAIWERVKYVKRKQNLLIVAAREQGMGYSQIGKHLGMSKSNVRDREKMARGYSFRYSPRGARIWFKKGETNGNNK